MPCTRSAPLLWQMDRILAGEGRAIWLLGTDMTALHLQRATKGLSSEQLLSPLDRTLMSSETISIDSMSLCQTRAHGEAINK